MTNKFFMVLIIKNNIYNFFSKMKLKVIFFLLFSIFFVSCSNTSQNNLENKTLEENLEENKTIIVSFGDSLTEGYGLNREDSYPKQLEEKLILNGFDVIVFNSGISGETSTSANSRKEWVLNLNPDIVILVTGANDGFRGIKTNIIKQNIEDIIDFFNEKNVKVILGAVPMSENLGEIYVKEFENMYKEISQEKEVFFIENFLEGVVANEKLNQKDRIHPTKEGYTYIVENNVYEIVKKVILEN